MAHVKMDRPVYFITHPNVVVSRDVPVPQWPLSELGISRMSAGLRQPWMREIATVWSSAEQKAIDGARILADHLSLDFTMHAELGENDRSATGFLSSAIELPQSAEKFAVAIVGKYLQCVDLQPIAISQGYAVGCDPQFGNLRCDIDQPVDGYVVLTGDI